MQAGPFCDQRGRPFRFCVPEALSAQLHHLDLERDAPGIDAGEFRRLGAKARACEAVASARLAGAGTPDDGTGELLRTGRPARSDAERMIANLHQALGQAESWRRRDLSPDMMPVLHRAIMDGLPGQTDAAGRFRRDAEAARDIGVGEGARLDPPPAGELAERLGRMCAFANGRSPGTFIHPLVRAAILHFWVVHDRPFADGNGRIARALFQWAMLRQGYSGFGLLAVSAPLAQAPGRYAASFARTAGDDNDLTYFILDQASAVQAAEQTLRAGIRRAKEQQQAAARVVRGFADLNPRQQALMAHTLRHPGVTYVIAGHQRSHGVTHQTARDDLFGLVRRSLLTVSREGRTYRFSAAGGPPD